MEGNLGLRVSATGIPEAVGPNAIIRAMDLDCEVTPDEVLAFASKLEAHPEYIPQGEKEQSLERAMATCAISTALRRHAGHYAEAADPVMGIMAGAAMGSRPAERGEGALRGRYLRPLGQGEGRGPGGALL